MNIYLNTYWKKKKKKKSVSWEYHETETVLQSFLCYWHLLASGDQWEDEWVNRWPNE